MAAFSLRLNLAMEVNRHFLENEYGDLSFFCVVLNLVINLCMYITYGPTLSVKEETIVENVNLASNCDFYHGTIVRICMESTRRCCS